MSIESLSRDSKKEIISYLDPSERMQMRLVSKEFNAALDESSTSQISDWGKKGLLIPPKFQHLKPAIQVAKVHQVVQRSIPQSKNNQVFKALLKNPLENLPSIRLRAESIRNNNLLQVYESLKEQYLNQNPIPVQLPEVNYYLAQSSKRVRDWLKENPEILRGVKKLNVRYLHSDQKPPEISLLPFTTIQFSDKKRRRLIDL